MESLVSVIGWIIYAVLELRQEILTAFAYVDAALILLGLIIYTRIRRQRHTFGKEKRTMSWRRRNQDEELLKDLGLWVEPVLEKGERVMRDLEVASTLPDVDQVKIQRFHEQIAGASKELRKILRVGVGPETIKGIKAQVKQLHAASYEAERTILGTKIKTDRYAWTVSGRVANFNASTQGIIEVDDRYHRVCQYLGLDPDRYVPRDALGNAVASFYGVELLEMFAATAGIDEVPHPAMTARQLLPSLGADDDGVGLLPRPDRSDVEVISADDPMAATQSHRARRDE